MLEFLIHQACAQRIIKNSDLIKKERTILVARGTALDDIEKNLEISYAKRCTRAKGLRGKNIFIFKCALNYV